MEDAVPRPSSALAAPAKRWYLTDAELELVRRVSEGQTNKDIAADLGKSPATVATRLSRLYERFDVGNRLGLVRVCAPLLEAGDLPAPAVHGRTWNHSCIAASQRA